MRSQVRLNVKAVCEITGIHPSTLRAWERRYGAVDPDRSETGRRTYTWPEVERLRLLVSLVGKGFAISQIAQWSDTHLSEHLRETSPQDQALGKQTHQWAQPLLKCVREYRLDQMQELLNRAKAQMGVHSFVLDLISPVLGEVGRGVASGSLSIGQEHALSAILRSHLLQLLYLFGGNRKKTLLFATPEGDIHEFGILLSAILCADSGYGVFYLGTNMPAQALVDATKALKPSALILGTSPSSATEIRFYLRDLEKSGLRTPVWVGGTGTHAAKKAKGQLDLRCFETLGDLKSALEGDLRP